jgi:hypothetical protein
MAYLASTRPRDRNRSKQARAVLFETRRALKHHVSRISRQFSQPLNQLCVHLPVALLRLLALRRNALDERSYSLAQRQRAQVPFLGPEVRWSG